MASYQHPQTPFYVGAQTGSQHTSQPHYPPTPNSAQDEFSPISYYDPTAFVSAPFAGGHYDIVPSTVTSTSPDHHHTHNIGMGRMGGVQNPIGGGDEGTRSHSPTMDHNGYSNNARGGRGSSEEHDLTPGQKRRKEQNRAAQRAFRERKERHVKELEIKLADLKQANSRAVAENDKLKAELEKTTLENRLLHENRSQSPHHEVPDLNPMAFKPLNPIESFSSSSNSTSVIGSNENSLECPPSMYSPPPEKFTSPIFGKHPNIGPIHRITTSPNTGERLLGAGAAWDLIICHSLYEQGLVDIGDISDRLKGVARCDGQGPVFEESVILDAIQASVASGRDDLLLDGNDDEMEY